jgi:mRNA-degrading endonuclease RelE of RelBE toxin-antitoxin system
LRLRGGLEGFWKDRVGEYRILYKIDTWASRIIFYDVDLRKRVYG